jgi:hypothetical protein
MGCIITGAIVVFRVFWLMQFWQGVPYLAKVAMLSITVWFLTFLLYPYSLSDWIAGLVRNARNVVPTYETDNNRLWSAWMVNSTAPFYGAIYALAAVCGLFQLIGRWNSAMCKSGCAISAMVILAAVVNYGLRNPGQRATLMLFAPLVVCFLVWNCTRGQGTRGFGLKLLTTGCLLLSASGFLRTSLIFPFFVKYGLGRDAGRQKFAEVRTTYEGSIHLSGGLFSLTDDYHHVNDLQEGAEYPTIVLQQANRGRTQPPGIEGYDLVEHQFSPIQPRLFGLKLGNTVGGYNFAVYRRKTAAP